MKTRWMSRPLRPVAGALLALLACVGGARADDADPPGRVARVAVAEGSVSLQPAGVQDWTNATLNRPLTTGDKLWTDQDSRAELDIGAAVVRLGATTGFSFINLDDTTAQMQVTAGTLIVRVRDMQGGQNYEIDTPNIALSLQQPGEYRIEVSDAGDSTVVEVSQGQAQASGGGQSIAIATQQMVTFSGTSSLSMASGTLGAPDELDNWSAQREHQAQDSASRQYVADDVAGTQDLDASGRWESTPDYGYVWTPTVLVGGWAPYRFGQWLWVAPWGWTWVDDAPWGYAPFHYGRWATWNGAWCWVPGPRHVRPVYAPALVAWVGGPGGLAAAGGNVGWFPLAPREVYVPGYHASPGYVRNVNVTNTTITNNTYITNVYENRVTNIHYLNNSVGAVTAVPQNVFASGQRIGTRAVRLPSATLAAAAVTAAAPAIIPSRQSVLGAGAGHAVAQPPAALGNRRVMARTPPPRAPAPFERQVAAMQANGGRALGRAELAQLQPAIPATPVRVVAGGNRVVSADALPRRPGPPATAGAGLAERERLLQNSRVTSPPRTDRPPGAYGAEAARALVSESPWRTERPSAQQHSTSTPQHGYSADDPAHAYGRPLAAPVNRSPASTAQPHERTQPYEQPQPFERPPEPQHQEERSRVPQTPPPAQAPRVPAPSPPPAPQQHPPAHSESREAGPHADRTSRERSER
jgi:uncharacterized protein DUF6600